MDNTKYLLKMDIEKKKYEKDLLLKKTLYFSKKKLKELEENEDLNIEEKTDIIDEYVKKCINNPIDMYPYIHKKKNSDNLVLRYFANPASVSKYVKSSGELLCDITNSYFDYNCMSVLGCGTWCLLDPKYDKIPFMTQLERDIILYEYLENFPREYFYDIYNYTEQYSDEGPWDDIIEEVEKRIYNEEERLEKIYLENEKEYKKIEEGLLLKEEEEEKLEYIDDFLVFNSDDDDGIVLSNDLDSDSDY